MQSLAIHHLALGSPDPESLSQFYREVFHLDESARHHDEQGGLRSIWLALNPGVLMIEKTTRPLRKKVLGVDAGFFLLAFESSDLQADHKRLEKLGGVIEERSEYSLYFRDPEGNRCALSAYPL